MCPYLLASVAQTGFDDSSLELLQFLFASIIERGGNVQKIQTNLLPHISTF
jgi:hypothetical protein